MRTHASCVIACRGWLQVAWDSPASLPSFFPPLSDSSPAEFDDGGPEATGTFADLTAWRQQRRYHAVHVPHDTVASYGFAPAAGRSLDLRLWHVVVTNTGGWIDSESAERVPRFLLRTGCYPSPAAVPCPRSLVDDSDCLGAGNCTRQPCASFPSFRFVPQRSTRDACCVLCALPPI